MPPHHARTNFMVSIVHAQVPGPQATALKEKQCNYNVALERPGTFILCRLSARYRRPALVLLTPVLQSALGRGLAIRGRFASGRQRLRPPVLNVRSRCYPPRLSGSGTSLPGLSLGDVRGCRS
jgi:hypothetical protein